MDVLLMILGCIAGLVAEAWAGLEDVPLLQNLKIATRLIREQLTYPRVLDGEDVEVEDGVAMLLLVAFPYRFRLRPRLMPIVAKIKTKMTMISRAV